MALTPESPDSNAFPELDAITLYGITAHGYHGVLDSERITGQDFTVDVTMYLSVRQAALTDDLNETVDYSAVGKDVAGIITGEPVWLIERLAERVAAVVLRQPRVEAVDVVVHKPEAPLEVHFTDVRVKIHRTRADVAAEVLEPAGELTRRPESFREVVFALGANLGDPVGTLRAVVGELRAHPRLRDVRVSPLARTEAVLAPGQAPQPDYYNCVVTCVSRLSARDLLFLAHHLENEHGRVRDERWGARTLDVDIVQIAGLESEDPELTLPHPRAAQRAFVLGPWAALDPQATLQGRPVADLADRAVDREGLKNFWEEWLEPGTVTAAIKLSALGAVDAGESAGESAEEPASSQSAGLDLPSWQTVLEKAQTRVVDDSEVDIIYPEDRDPKRPRWRQVRKED